MSDRVLGMDTDEGRRVARDLDDGSTQLSGVMASAGDLASRIGQLWTGSDANAFTQDVQDFCANAQQAARSLNDQARRLLLHADEQDRASA